MTCVSGGIKRLEIKALAVYPGACGLKNLTAPLPQPFGHTSARPTAAILARQFMQIQCIPVVAASAARELRRRD